MIVEHGRAGGHFAFRFGRRGDFTAALKNMTGLSCVLSK